MEELRTPEKNYKSTREKLAERNTHVQIADKYGRDTLEEYVGDSLVSGPDEATKLRKTESSIQNDLFVLTM